MEDIKDVIKAPILDAANLMTDTLVEYYVENGMKYRKTRYPGGGTVIDIIGDENADENQPFPEFPPGGQTPEEKFSVMESENKILKAQNQALSDRAEFIENVITEMAIMLYQ
ncbi:hypothetical protein D3C76_1285780 [compost metagenome]